jgi:hypothetical protein
MDKMKVVRRKKKVLLLNELGHDVASWRFKSLQKAEKAKKEMKKQNLEEIYMKVKQRWEHKEVEVPPCDLHDLIVSRKKRLEKWERLRKVKLAHPEIFEHLEFVEEEPSVLNIWFYRGIENKRTGHDIKFFWEE